MLCLRSISRFILISLALLGLSISSANSATLTVVGGELLGATGVDVGGTLYDVEFVDGSCISLFAGCDDTSDFTFQTFIDRSMASQALLDQVFIDSVLGRFDTEPRLTAGCDNLLICVAFTGAGMGSIFGFPLVYFAIAVNGHDEARDGTGRLSGLAGGPAPNDRFTFARWATSPVSVVPVPAAVWLFGTALLGLVGFSKRKSRIAA